MPPIRPRRFAICLLALTSLITAPASADVPAKLASHTRVQAALKLLQADDAANFREQIEISEIPAPPFKESVRAQDYLRRLQALGLKDAYIDTTGNVIGLRKGTRGKPLLVLSAHLDTVFPEGTDVTVNERDGRFYGRGLADDSRGLAALLTLLRALEQSGIRTVGDLMFVATVGEEGLGDLRGVKGLFRDQQNIDGFISVDSTAGEAGHGIVAHATGSHRWEIEFKGPGGHSFGAFGTPSAIHAMGRAIGHIAEVRTPKEPRTTYTVGVVSGGTSVNTIASDAKMLVDIRSNDAQQLLLAEQKIMSAIEKGVAEENIRWQSQGIRLERKLLGDRPAGAAPAGSPMVAVSLKSWQALGLPAPTVETASTDSNVPIGLGIPAITVSGGGEGGGEHGPDEWYKPVNGFHGPQVLLLTALTLAGLDGVSRPELPVRRRPD